MEVMRIITANFILLQAGLHAKDLELLKTTRESFCPKGWHPFGELCYKGFPEVSISDKRYWDNTLNFEAAENHCRQLGGHLVSISSSEVQDFVTAHVLLAFEHRAYIGLIHNESVAKMHWTDGSELEYTAWDTNEPSKKAPGGESEHCVEMTFVNVLNRMGRWNDIACNGKLPYICQKAKGFDDQKPEKDSSLCPLSNDGLYYRKSCYYFSTLKKSWDDAEQYCMDHYDGHLASVTDVAVQTLLSYSMVQKNYNRMWIGIQLKPDDIPLWSSGWFIGFSNWKENPSPKTTSASDSSCAAMINGSEKPNGQWAIELCKEARNFVCEKSSVEPPPRLNATETGLLCPSDDSEWVDLGGDYCYIFRSKDFVTWYHANFICMSKGGTLVSVHSKAEEDIFEQFIRYRQNDVYIGLYRGIGSKTSQNGEFVWADHSTVDYENWRYGEPNSVDEMCVEVTRTTLDWNDVKCDNLRGFICSAHKISLNSRTKGAQKPSTQGKNAPSNRSTDGTVSNQPQGKCECLPTPAIIGVVLCVLLVCVLVGVVLYNVKPWKKSQENTSKRKSSSSASDKARYRTGQRVASEQIYENMDI